LIHFYKRCYKMDNSDLFQSCRRGDLDRVRYLVEHKEIELNQRDKWDSTPLYYACLCGHQELVVYLLERGSICDAATFDGERCVYGALTNQIRKLLLEHRMLTTVTMRREPYTEFLRRLLEDENHKDIVFIVHGNHISAHRCILAARSEFFAQQLETRWRGKREVVLNKKQISFPAFQALLEWLYTAQTKLDVKDMEDLSRLVKYCQLPQLNDQLMKAFKKADSFVQSKRGVTIRSLYLESTECLWDLQQDFGVLSQQALPTELRFWNTGLELPCMPSVQHNYVDLILQVEDLKFSCHKCVLFARTEYFRALMQDHFCESEVGEDEIRIIKINHVTPRVLGDVLVFVYTNSCQITEQNVADLLNIGDMFLLPGLKRECGAWLGKYIDQDTVLDILRTSRMYQLPRLEDLCTEYLSLHIESFVENAEFHEIICEDAREIKNREETDSIQIIDDIRSHISSNVRSIYEAESRRNCLEEILAYLGLDA